VQLFVEIEFTKLLIHKLIKCYFREAVL